MTEYISRESVGVQSPKYYIRILLITCVILFLLCLLFSGTTMWANYVVIKNREKIEEMQPNKSANNMTYTSKYNYDSLGEIERLIQNEYESALKGGITSVSLEDIRIESDDDQFDLQSQSHLQLQSPIMINLVMDSWISASEYSTAENKNDVTRFTDYIMNETNTNRILVEFSISTQDIDRVKKYMSAKSSSSKIPAFTMGTLLLAVSSAGVP